MTTTSKIILGILGASVAGLAIGLLIAPEKGTEMRNKIANNSKDLLTELKDWMGKKQKHLGEIRKTASRRADEFSDVIDTEWDTPRSMTR